MIVSRIEERVRDFQRSGDPEEVKRRREETQVELRKQKRTEQAFKRRIPHTSSTPLPPTLQELADLLDKVRRGIDLENAVVKVTEILGSENPPFSEMMNLGGVPLLIALLGRDDIVGEKAAWGLVNLSSGPVSITETIVSNQGVQALVAALNHSNPTLVDYCFNVLANIAGDSIPNRDLIISLGVTEKIFSILKVPKGMDVGYVDNITWLLSLLCRGQPSPPDSVITSAIAISTYLLSTAHSGIVSNGCWMLSHITESAEPRWIDQVINLGITSRLIDLTQSPKDNERIPALRVIGNLLCGEDKHVQILLTLGLLDKLMILVSSRKKDIRKEVLWAFSNVTGGTKEQEKAVVMHSGFSLLVSAMADQDMEIRKEAVQCIGNLAKAPDQDSLSRLLAHNVLESLILVLQTTPDPSILLIALEAVSRILRCAGISSTVKSPANDVSLRFEEAGGITAIETLQRHANILIYEKAVEMMGVFFGLEESMQGEEMGEVPSGGFQFS